MTKADLAYARFWSLVMLGFFGSSFFLWIVVGRVPLWSLWIFGEASYGTWSIEAAGPKLGHLYAAQESLPACALLLIATRSKRHWPLALILLLAAITVLFAGLGIRTRILLAVGSAMAFYYLEKDKRPSVWQIILMGFIVFYVIAGAIGYYRGAGRAPGQDAFGLAEAWDTFAEGSNIATTTLVYVHWVPVFGYDWGRSFLQVLLTPIPSALWPDKYLLFGKPAIGEFIAYGAAAPFLITFYVSFGPAGIVFGMALIGWLCHRMYNAYKANPRDPFAQILVALLWAYLFHVYGRHSVTLIVYGVVYVFAPVWIVRWLVTKRQRGRNTSRLQMV